MATKRRDKKIQSVFLNLEQLQALTSFIMPTLRKNQDMARDISQHIGNSRPGDACFHPRWRMTVMALEGVNRATAYEILGTLQDQGIIEFDEDWKYRIGNEVSGYKDIRQSELAGET